MRTLPIGIGLAAAAMFAAAGAHAQFTSHELVPGTDIIVAPTPSFQPDQRVATPPPVPAGVQSGIAGNADGSNDYPRPHPSLGARSPVSATARDYPLSWNGSAQDWTLHSQACAAKYPGYDPATDTYQLRRGVRAMCPQMFGRNR